MRRLICATAAAGLALLPLGVAHADDPTDIDVSVVIPEATTELSDAVLSWALNDESGSGAYNGSCNFLSAGVAGDAGSSRAWTSADGLYQATDGNVAIEKPTPAGWAAATWDTRCLDERAATPRQVTPAPTDRGTGNRFVMSGGEGTFDPASNSAHVQWRGSVTLVSYGGLSYFWLTDPELNVSDGAGSLTATLGGYGSSREDASKWAKLAPKKVRLATLNDVDLAKGAGFTATPAFAHVKVEAPAGSTPQVRSGDAWGAFPQSLVDYVNQVGQSAYWYSTGAIRDFAKVATPVNVSWSATQRVDDEIDEQAEPARPGATRSGDAEVTPAAGVTDATPRAQAPAVTPVALPAAGWGGPGTQGVAQQSVANAAASTELETSQDPRALLVVATTALLALAGIAAVGFSAGWLVLPGSAT